MAFVDRLGDLDGTSSTDRAEVARQIGLLPKAIEKSTWDALAVRDSVAPVIVDRSGNPQPDPDLRDNENAPLPAPVERFDEDPTARLASPPYRAAVNAHMAAEVFPYVPDAWVDLAKTKVGYEIPLTRQFYRYIPPRPLEVIDAEITALEAEIQSLIAEATSR